MPNSLITNYIGKNGPENVYDNKWSWGGVWASFEIPEITFELYEMRELYGFSLYFNGNISEQLNFEVFIDDEKGNIVKTLNVNKVNQLKVTSNKNRITSILVFHFVKVKGKRLRIKFLNASKKNPISLTETNIFFNMDFETEMIYKEIQRRRKIDSEYY